MYTALVNDDPTPQHVRFEAGQPLLNDQAFDWDLTRLTDRTFSIIRGNRSYLAEVLAIDAVAKTVTLQINQSRHTVQLRDRFDVLLAQMGLSSAASAKVTNLKAPMPGLIVGFGAAPGDAVRKGDTLLVLEAMKMENTLKAPADAVIKTIRVAKGDRVEKGQILIEFA